MIADREAVRRWRYAPRDSGPYHMYDVEDVTIPTINTMNSPLNLFNVSLWVSSRSKALHWSWISAPCLYLYTSPVLCNYFFSSWHCISPISSLSNRSQPHIYKALESEHSFIAITSLSSPVHCCSAFPILDLSLDVFITNYLLPHIWHRVDLALSGMPSRKLLTW